VQKAVIMLIKHRSMKTYWGSLGTAPHTRIRSRTLEGSDGQLQETADILS
jgi:hypothetical protein